MISPWTVYWVLQLDSIKTGVGVFSILGLVLIGAAMAGILGISTMPPVSDGDRCLASKHLPRLGRAWVVCLALAASNMFLPTTKTACAILTIPAVANNETLQTDLTEVYQLGMERIKEELGATDNQGENRESSN